MCTAALCVKCMSVFNVAFYLLSGDKSSHWSNPGENCHVTGKAVLLCYSMHVVHFFPGSTMEEN